MPLPQNLNVIMGAGVFGIVCAATLYVMEHYRQDRRRHAMAKDLARLNTELAVLRKELDTLLAQQQKQRVSKRPKRLKKESVSANSIVSDDYSSAVDGDSSELEFYDVSDDELEPEMDLERIDGFLETGNSSELDSCLNQLQNLCLEFPENPQLLWRLGKAHYKLFLKTEQKDHLNKGIEACESALLLTPELANAHKWLGILIGERSKHQPIRERILDGLAFKKHVDAAIGLDPMDSSLHHMLGRFVYDVADLKWYERKVASALVSEMPRCTFEEALEIFLEAERLEKKQWKANLLYIAKCRIKLGLEEDAVRGLEEAAGQETDEDEAEIDNEITELLQKHRR